jgi:lambda family phage portal protein
MERRLNIVWRGGVPVKSYYEAGKRSSLHKQRVEKRSANGAILPAGRFLREQARHLDQNHDLARGALNTLVQNIVGPKGIQAEPCPLTKSGKIHDGLARQIEHVLDDWYKKPEVTWTHDWPAAQRLIARTWLRDGEALSQTIKGNVPTLDHGTTIPYSLELIEPDLLPLDYNANGDKKIVSAIQINGWNRPTYYHLYKEHPGDSNVFLKASGMKAVPARKILHLKLVDRIGQLRGVSLFASVILRLDDIKDYEESERIAAKVAASMAAYIKKGSPDRYDNEIDSNGEAEPRDLRFRPGMVFDDLLVGEDIGIIDTKRPSTQLEPHRNGQLRAAGRGLCLSYSAVSGDYNGTYSAQRQELVEGYGAYGVLASEFIGQFVRPNYTNIIEMAMLSGVLDIPSDVDIRTIANALYIPPQMPWIDPLKEAVSLKTLEENTHASGLEIIRKRGNNPREVVESQRRWLEMKKDIQTPESMEAATTAAANRIPLTAEDLFN